MRKISNKTIAGTAILLAVQLILQFLGNFIQLGPVSINLSLIPIAIGAIIYGPLVGLFLGFVNGIVVLFSPTTIGLFMNPEIGNIPGTIITCLTKCSIAGLVSGFVFKAFKNKHEVLGAILSALTLPLVNTGLFVGFSMLFFRKILFANMGNFSNIFAVLIFGFIGWNFIFELATTIILAPAIVRIMSFYKKRINHGQSK